MQDETNPAERAESRALETAAVLRGTTQERDRVLAHLHLGESCGDMAIALEAIRSGAGMTLELNARYLSAGMNRGDRTKRQAESNGAESVVVTTGASPVAADVGDQLVVALKGSDRSFIRA